MSRISITHLLKRTYSSYFLSWRRHFMTALPVSIFSVLIYVGGNELLHEVSRGHGLTGKLDFSFWMLIGRTLAIRIPEFGLPWVMTTFAFAAISSAAMKIATSDAAPRIADAYTAARERSGAICVVGLLTFAAAVLGYGIIVFCLMIWSGMIPRHHFAITVQAIWWLGITVWIALLCRAALSIPCLLDDPKRSAWQSIRDSIRLSKGFELFFFIVTGQTLFLSVVLLWLVKLGLFQILDAGLINEEVYVWAANAIYAALAAIIENVAFVGFTELYLVLTQEQNAPRQDVGSMAVGAPPVFPR